MKTRLMILFCLLSILALLPLWEASPASAGGVLPQNKPPARLELTARRLTNDLSRGGFEIARGYFKLYTKEDNGLLTSEVNRIMIYKKYIYYLIFMEEI